LEDHDEITAFFRVNDSRGASLPFPNFKGAIAFNFDAKPVGASLLAMGA
jgi:hypothetical protein